MKKIVIILGPTAVGKSEMGINLAKKFGGEIISCDSVQVYKGLNIGSAKIKEAEMQGVSHHLIDFLPPESEFSVAEFVELVKQKIDEVTSRGHLPILVGGTGLYIRALLGGYDFGGVAKNSEFRASLEKMETIELYNMLLKESPKKAAEISKSDKKRIIRALEIQRFGSIPKKSKCEYDPLIFVLNLDRKKLYDRINLRTEKMFSEGLIDEVKSLILAGTSKLGQSMKAIGYKEVILFLDGQMDKESLVELVKQHTRNYSKRQLTFFRSIKEAIWIDTEDKTKALNEISRKIKEFL